jgi:circadian clock protein KaiC
MSMIKKRSGSHENTIREYQISSNGLSIGPPLVNFQGILRGMPVYSGSSKNLLSDYADVQGDEDAST